MNQLRRLLIPILLFGVAFAFRLLSWHSVFQAGGVYPNGNDAYYHLRRIRYSVENFPEVLGFDSLMNFPEGARAIWSPTFDWSIAALLRLVPGIDQPGRLETIVVFVPPLLGALTVIIVYFLGQRFFSQWVAVVAAGVMAILPAHSVYSRLGAVDHHVLVAMIVAVMLGLAMNFFRDDEDGAESGSADRDPMRMGASLGVGLSIGAAVLVWPGTLLHIGLLQIAMVIRLLWMTDAAMARTWALRLVVVHGVALFVVLPMTIGNVWEVWGAYSPVVLSNFQPAYFFAAVLCFGMLGGLWRVDRIGSTRSIRMASAGLVGIVVILGLLVCVPELLAAIEDALSWFAKDEEFQSVVNESVPLFGGVRGPARAVSLLSRFVYVVPLSIAYFGWQFRSRPERLLLIGWALALYLVMLVQWRFVNSYSIAHCLLVGLTTEALYLAARSRLSMPAGKWALGTVAVLLALFVFMPSFRSYGLNFDNFKRQSRGEVTIPVGNQLHARFVADAARFLRDHSPEGGGPYGAAEYSVLGPWGDGHILKTVGERAVVQDNFGDDVAPENFRRAEAYYSAKSEAAGLAILAPMKTRYVLVRSTGSGHSQGYSFDSLFSRLFWLKGSLGVLESNAGENKGAVNALGHHRLIYQSPPLDGKGPEPYVMLFEVVPGVEIVGRAEPGAVVSVWVAVLPRDGAKFRYTTTAEADSSGVYRLRLPYANDLRGSNVQVGSKYSIYIGEEGVKVAITEAEVLAGTRLAGPDFAARSSN